MAETIPDASQNGGAWGFSKKDAGRIAQVVKRLEAQVYNRDPARGRYPVLTGTGTSLLDFYAGSGIAAGSFSSPASADVTLYVQGSGAAMTTTGGDTVTAYNQWNIAVAAGKSGKGQYRGGYFYVVLWDC